MFTMRTGRRGAPLTLLLVVLCMLLFPAPAGAAGTLDQASVGTYVEHH